MPDIPMIKPGGIRLFDPTLEMRSEESSKGLVLSVTEGKDFDSAQVSFLGQTVSATCAHPDIKVGALVNMIEKPRGVWFATLLQKTWYLKPIVDLADNGRPAQMLLCYLMRTNPPWWPNVTMKSKEVEGLMEDKMTEDLTDSFGDKNGENTGGEIGESRVDAFNRLDMNHDGYLTSDECNFPELWDIDGDGRLSREEWMGRGNRYMNQADVPDLPSNLRDYIDSQDNIMVMQSGYSYPTPCYQSRFTSDCVVPPVAGYYAGDLSNPVNVWPWTPFCDIWGNTKDNYGDLFLGYSGFLPNYGITCCYDDEYGNHEGLTITPPLYFPALTPFYGLRNFAANYYSGTIARLPAGATVAKMTTASLASCVFVTSKDTGETHWERGLTPSSIAAGIAVDAPLPVFVYWKRGGVYKKLGIIPRYHPFAGGYFDEFFQYGDVTGEVTSVAPVAFNSIIL
jgi:hypothetical protein